MQIALKIYAEKLDMNDERIKTIQKEMRICKREMEESDVNE
jgi:hypothetical protein